jgi:Tat protein secretion system quality control protein TatD with DNase activity
VARKLAELKKVGLNQLAEITTQNAQRVFGMLPSASLR